MANQDTADATPDSWWKWALRYHQLPVALLGALGTAIAFTIPHIPNLHFAFRNNVSVNEADNAREQLGAWRDNVKCIQEISTVALPATVTYTVSIQACPSGDLLLILRPLNGEEVNYWVRTSKLFERHAGLSFTATALAQASQPQQAPSPVRVIDGKQQGTTIVRRLQLSDNTCIDEVIDPVRGRRVSSQRAPCTRF